MTITAELLAEMETASKRYRVTSDQLAELEVDTVAEEITITWQRVTDRTPSVLVTVPAGQDGWAVPVPHRPDWLLDLIVKKSPKWWMK